MKVTIERRWKKDNYTIGRLSIDGVYFCDTLEDVDRGLYQGQPLKEMIAQKVPGFTAIPTGGYMVEMSIVSPKYSKNDFYKSLCNGKVPRVMDVPCFAGILIHCGNTIGDTEGCILVGRNREKGKVLDSRETFRRLYLALKKASDDYEPIELEIY